MVDPSCDPPTVRDADGLPSRSIASVQPLAYVSWPPDPLATSWDVAPPTSAGTHRNVPPDRMVVPLPNGWAATASPCSVPPDTVFVPVDVSAACSSTVPAVVSDSPPVPWTGAAMVNVPPLGLTDWLAAGSQAAAAGWLAVSWPGLIVTANARSITVRVAPQKPGNWLGSRYKLPADASDPVVAAVVRYSTVLAGTSDAGATAPGNGLSTATVAGDVCPWALTACPTRATQWPPVRV